MKIMDAEQRIRKLEQQVAELRQAMVLVGVNMGTGRYEYERALRELIRGNRKPFNEYVKRGGQPHEDIPAE